MRPQVRLKLLLRLESHFTIETPTLIPAEHFGNG